MLYEVEWGGALESSSTPGSSHPLSKSTSIIKVVIISLKETRCTNTPMIRDCGLSLCGALFDMEWTRKAGCENKQTLARVKIKANYKEI